MSDRAVVQIPVTLDAANRRKDRSASLRFSSTQELRTADFAELDPAHTIRRLAPVRSERVDEGDICARRWEASFATPACRLIHLVASEHRSVRAVPTLLRERWIEKRIQAIKDELS